jgi:undecaprenyl diphosphate synthase
MQNVKTIALTANNLGVKVLTLFAFSTENWQRPQEEVNFLMKLPIDFFDTFIPDLIENGVKVQVIGDVTGLPKATQKAVLDAIDLTKDNKSMILNFALNYGGRTEIVEAAKNISQMVKDGEIDIEDIDDNLINQQLQTADLGILSDPDLIIRTSGEQRLSNFLLWQTAYSEFYFSDKLWPDFTAADLEDAFSSFSGRSRRFGKVDDEDDNEN